MILPNIALLSDEECAALKTFAENGGSIMASFETSLFNERNERRKDFGIADLMGIHVAGEQRTRVGNGFMGRIERQHPILEGFSEHRLASGRKVASADRSGRESGDDRHSSVCELSSGTRVSARREDRHAGPGGKGDGSEQAGLFCRRH